MYDVNYFIEKFEAIPEDKWCTMSLEIEGRHCALGHCSVYKMNERLHGEGQALVSLLFNSLGFSVFYINDRETYDYPQNSPKQRILAALYDIRDKEIQEANVNAAKEIIEVESKVENVLV